MDTKNSQSIGENEYVEVTESKKRPRWVEMFIGIPGILGGALLGFGLGFLLKETGASDTFISWIALPGDLFIRGLKCLVAPLVFCSIVTGMADLINVGKASSIGWKTAVLFIFTTFLASLQGIVWVTVFKSSFEGTPMEEKVILPEISIECYDGKYLSASENGTIFCASDNVEDGTLSETSKFILNDLNGYYQSTQTSVKRDTLSEALQGQLKAMVPDNITAAFGDAIILSIVMFAVPFGLALAFLPKRHKIILDFFKELNLVFMNLVTGIIFVTPIAVLFMIAGSIAVQTDMGQLFSDVGTFIACVSLGIFGHNYIILPSLLYLTTHTNPLKFYKAIIPAQIFAFSCASSMAALPITIKCLDSTKAVSKALTRFVASLGVTINMDGSAVFYPCAIVFMGASSGVHIGSVEMLTVAIVTFVGAIGSAPTPGAGSMVVILWYSVFPDVPLPSTFSYILATDFILDRFVTVTNITGDAVSARIIAHITGEDELKEQSLDRKFSIESGNL